jgi:putative transposase
MPSVLVRVKFALMTRLARMVVSGLPHRVTQRGNRREPMFFGGGDQENYRDLLGEQARKADVAMPSLYERGSRSVIRHCAERKKTQTSF